jgi:bifunctional non-homologous end joining protein LigD
MGLREYQRKRHFKRTPEPVGKLAKTKGRLFVVQKHDARNLHYDFRLELEGVLKSWAVPKGPSLDPSVKRLAMQVEDHPVEYGSFEGIIPEGDYGGGTVMLWDRGTWEPIGNPHESYREGKFKFVLHGEKLRGRWMLVRTRSFSRDGRDERNGRHWLLFKERDSEARSADDDDVLEAQPLSVATGRSLNEIALDRDHVWGSNKSNGKVASRHKPVRAARAKQTDKSTPSTKLDVSKLPGAKTQRQLPVRVNVELATLTKEAPEGDEWLHEIKLDGYRMICRIDHGRVEFITRNHKSWTDKLPSLVEAAKRLPVSQAILDGELVALRPDGTTNFEDLQNVFKERRVNLLHYYVFDLLHLNGYDLTEVGLEARKGVLETLLQPASGINFHLSEHVDGSGPDFFQQACKMHLEGIISKRRDRPYRPGRGYDWLKIKCLLSDEFVIGGYTDPTGSRIGFGALLVGTHDPKGKLIYAGKVGTGFNDAMLRSLMQGLKPLNSDESPFSDLKRGARGTHWVKPELVAQVTFGSRTRDGRLRQPSFQGLREDKPASEVIVEKPVPLAKIVAKGNTATRS